MNEKTLKTAEEIFTGSFSIWVIATRAASFKARLQAEDLNLDVSDIAENVHLGNKDMISDKDRIFLNQSNSQIQSFMKMVSRRFFGRGLYAVPEAKVLACQEGLTRIREAQRERVEDFLSRYPEEMRKQKEAHPNLAGETWPTPEDVRKFYSISWKVFSVQAMEAKETDPDELIQAKEQFKEDLRTGYEELKDQILGESYSEILQAIETISRKIELGEKITETNFKKPRQILDQYLSISSIFDLPEIAAKIKAVKDTLDGTAAKDLREKPFVSKLFKQKLSDLGKDIETATGFSKDGRMKRTLDLDEGEPTPEPATVNGN